MEFTIAQLLEAIRIGKRSFQSPGSSSESVEMFQSTHVGPLRHAFEQGFLERLPLFHKQSMDGTHLCDHVSVQGGLSNAGIQFIKTQLKNNVLI